MFSYKWQHNYIKLLVKGHSHKVQGSISTLPCCCNHAVYGKDHGLINADKWTTIQGIAIATMSIHVSSNRMQGQQFMQLLLTYKIP